MCVLKLQCVAVCDSVLQCVAVCCSVLQCWWTRLIRVWHVSFICALHCVAVCCSALQFVAVRCSADRQGSFVCDMSHSCVFWFIHTWHGSFMCDMTHSFLTWLIHVWHDSFPHKTRLICVWHVSLMRGVTHSDVTWPLHMWHDLIMCSMHNGSNSTHVGDIESLQHTATHCNTLQHPHVGHEWRIPQVQPVQKIATKIIIQLEAPRGYIKLQHTATHCNAPQ